MTLLKTPLEELESQDQTQDDRIENMSLVIEAIAAIFRAKATTYAQDCAGGVLKLLDE